MSGRRPRPAGAALAVALAAAGAAAAALAGCERGAAPQAAALAAGPPARVISLAPSTTELVFALGAGDRLVGVTSACDWPEAARAVERVGGYDAPSVEVVLGLRPDLVLVPQEGSLLGPVEALRAHGVRVEPVAVASLPELYDACRWVGARLGRAEAGEALAALLAAREAAVRARVRGAPRPRVLLVVDHRPTVAAGAGTFAAALLEAAGADNALDRTAAAWPQLSLEALAALDPEVVIDTSMADLAPSARAAEQARLWARLPALRAVREGRVHALEPALLVRPGPRLLDGLEALARALHPGRFADPSVD